LAYQLAALNIARMKYSYESAEMTYFVQQLDPVNAFADKSPGFVWRMIEDEENPADYTVFEEPGYLVNMSVWQSLEHLVNFVRSEIHLDVMKRRKQWFESSDEASMVLWWVQAGHLPAVAEAQAKLEHLRTHGSSARAFSFRDSFPPPATAA
jgi:hypothetical protein